jgi:hypothetical protein
LMFRFGKSFVTPPMFFKNVKLKEIALIFFNFKQ